MMSAREHDLSVHVNGLDFENPFVTGSGPPGTNYAVMKKAFDEGWGGNGEVIGWENIELISDRPLEVMLEDFARLKREYPDRMLIASIMEEYDKEGGSS
eukprot:jgi/Picre1/29252/NNA_004644.t1